jgi:uncharacterized protein
MWTIIISGFTLGLISSIHCVGMCGPIALALPVHHLAGAKRVFSLVLYNIGRLITYSILGLTFGLLGRKLHIAGLQQWLSICIGVLIIVFLVYSYQRKTGIKIAGGDWFHMKVQVLMGKLLHSKSLSGLTMLGILNGLLPCGMVYLAIAGAVNTNKVWDGSLFMMMYGVGTLPAMLTLSLFGFMISLKARNNLKNIMPFLVGAIAILLILRGMNLGIPFISPEINHHTGTAVSCH